MSVKRNLRLLKAILALAVLFMAVTQVEAGPGQSRVRGESKQSKLSKKVLNKHLYIEEGEEGNPEVPRVFRDLKLMKCAELLSHNRQIFIEKIQEYLNTEGKSYSQIEEEFKNYYNTFGNNLVDIARNLHSSILELSDMIPEYCLEQSIQTVDDLSLKNDSFFIKNMYIKLGAQNFERIAPLVRETNQVCINLKLCRYLLQNELFANKDMEYASYIVLYLDFLGFLEQYDIFTGAVHNHIKSVKHI